MEIKNISNYYELLQNKFPDLSLQDIKTICLFGLKSLYLNNLYGGDVCVEGNGLWMYIGNLTKDSVTFFNYYRRKLSTKIRILNKRLKIPWDGYYYFALFDDLQKQVELQIPKNGNKNKKINYGKVILYRLLEDCSILQADKKYIYRIPYISEIGDEFWEKELITNKAELLEIREPLTFKDILTTNNKYKYGG